MRNMRRRLHAASDLKGVLVSAAKEGTPKDGALACASWSDRGDDAKGLWCGSQHREALGRKHNAARLIVWLEQERHCMQVAVRHREAEAGGERKQSRGLHFLLSSAIASCAASLVRPPTTVVILLCAARRENRNAKDQ